MKYVSTIRKQFALLAFAAIAMLSPNYAFAGNTPFGKCNHSILDDKCVAGCGSYVIEYNYEANQGSDKHGIKLNSTAGDFGDAQYLGTASVGGKWYWFFDRQVTHIESGAFDKKKMEINISEVSLPEGVTTLDPDVFAGCVTLENISLPSTLTSIGSGAFSGCTSLESVVIPANVTTIEAGAFSGCSSLSNVVIPEGVQTIEAGAFENCSSLTSITLPESLTTVEGEAFSGCEKLTTVVVKNEETQIDETSFEGCEKIEEVSGTLEQIEKIGGISSDNADKPVDPSTPSGPSIKKWETPVLTDKGYLDVKKSYPDMTIKFDTYLRSDIANAWGTLCVPFEVSKIEGVVKFYQLKSVDFETGAFVFSEVSTVDAGVPCVFQKITSESSLEFTPSVPVELSSQVKASTLELSDGWSIIGTYEPLNISVKEGGNAEGQNIFYIARNQFLSINGSVNINPFRAYFKYDGIIPSSAASARFTLETADMYETGLNTQFVNEQENGVLYDLLGNRVDQMVKGRIYILNGKKVMFK